MSTTIQTEVHRRRTLVASIVALILVVAYTVVPIRPQGVAAQSEADKNSTAHTVCPANRKLTEIPADTRFSKNQRALVTTQNDKDLVDACAREADTAKAQAATARAAGAEQKSVPKQAVVFSLGDVLFASGRADLKSDAMGNLDRLVSFLDRYSDRKVAIYGYSDNLGSEEDNQNLSERRANFVKTYLTVQGIDSTRLSASGMGQSDPVASNMSGAGRQQNRRVEVVISNPPAELAHHTPTAKVAVLLMLLQSISGKGRPLL